jgi:CRISPR-associated protein Cmr5
MTRQQRWSIEALSFIVKIKERGEAAKAEKEEFRATCQKLPILIKQSGLVQALAFLYSRQKDKDKNKDKDRDTESVERQLCGALAAVYEKDLTGRKLIEKAARAGVSEYLALSRDLIEISTWFRRFAQSELPPPEKKAS